MSTPNLSITPIGETFTRDPQFLDVFHAGMATEEAKAADDKFMSGLLILPYLNVVKSRVGSWARNRPMLLAKVVCASWATETALKTADRYIVPNPTRFYEVHIEVAVPIGKSTVAVYVVCEPTPFVHQSKFKLLADAETVLQFQKRRKEFQAAFAQECRLLTAEGRLPKVKTTTHNTMVGKVEYIATNKTVVEVSELIAGAIDDLASAINVGLRDVDEQRRAKTCVVPAEPISPHEVTAGVEEIVSGEHRETVTLPEGIEREEVTVVETQTEAVSPESMEGEEAPIADRDVSSDQPVTNSTDAA
jgi:hypothetical protein